jgi:hypothetical protein
MAIMGLIRAARAPRARAGGLTAATAVLLAAVLLGGCGGKERPALSTPAEAQSKPAPAAPVRTMRLEKDYTDANGNRFTIQVAIDPIKDGGTCADISAPDAYSHAMVLTVKSDAAKSRKARVPRIGAKDRAVTFTSKDATGDTCTTIISNSDQSVLKGGESKRFNALISRPGRDDDDDLVLIVWPKGKPQEELLHIPLRSLP